MTNERRLRHGALRVSYRALAGLMAFVVALAMISPATIAAESSHVAAQEWPVPLKKDMVRLGLVEWRLRGAALNTCAALAADAGLTIDDRRAYDRKDWPLLARTIGLREDPVVTSVIAGGPASRGGLREGDEILSINGQSVGAIVERRKAGVLVAEALIEEIAASEPDHPITIAVRRARATQQIRVQPVWHCAARLVLVTDGGVDAHSDSRNVAISAGLITFARNDDEIALAAGHELAHIILRHRKGGGISARRQMEDDADSLGLRLMHCAGYDAGNGLGLFQRLGKGDWLGFLRAPTHRSFAKRVVRLKAELPGLTCPASIEMQHRG